MSKQMDDQWCITFGVLLFLFWFSLILWSIDELLFLINLHGYGAWMTTISMLYQARYLILTSAELLSINCTFRLTLSSYCLTHWETLAIAVTTVKQINVTNIFIITSRLTLANKLYLINMQPNSMPMNTHSMWVLDILPEHSVCFLGKKTLVD